MVLCFVLIIHIVLMLKIITILRVFSHFVHENGMVFINKVIMKAFPHGVHDNGMIVNFK